MKQLKNNIITESFSIRNLAAEFSVTPRALRFYEQKGLLSPVRKGVTRHFTKSDRARLKLIIRGKNLGFTLSEIKELLDLYYSDNTQIKQLRSTLNRANERLELLNKQELDLAETIKELKKGIFQVEELLKNKGVLINKK